MSGSLAFLETLFTVKQKLAEDMCRTLLHKGYASAAFCRTAGEAAAKVMRMIPASSSIGIPGSVTVRQLGLPESLSACGHTVHQHWGYAYTFEDKERQNSADWFITSSNAITVDGIMVNIDGAGNRVACMAWGRSEVIYVVGMNKVVPDLETAISRARHCASPPNAARTSGKTPCVQTGRCMNCESDARICRVMLVMERAPFDRKCHVILIGESLGY